jgi:hypothetical protein
MKLKIRGQGPRGAVEPAKKNVTFKINTQVFIKVKEYS